MWHIQRHFAHQNESVGIVYAYIGFETTENGASVIFTSYHVLFSIITIIIFVRRLSIVSLLVLLVPSVRCAVLCAEF